MTEAEVQTPPKKKQSSTKKKVRKNISTGIVHIKASFNNTNVTVTDVQGRVIAWATSGICGFKGARKSTPYAAGLAAKNAIDKAKDHGLRTVTVQVKGPGTGRESAIRALQSTGIKVLSIEDVTPIPHNGCRPSKQRRV